MDEFQVVVKFGSGIPADGQGVTMLAMERWFREHGVPAVVVKETMADDSKLRRNMTPLERAKL